MRCWAAVAGLVAAAVFALVAGIALVKSRAPRGVAPFRPRVSVSPVERPSAPLPPIVSADEQERARYEAERGPFWIRLRQRCGPMLISHEVGDDIGMLDLTVASDDLGHIRETVGSAIQPDAREFGFRKVRFLVRNPGGSAIALRLVAEATLDDAGRWNVFMK